MGLNTTPPTFTAGQVVTAANLNTVADGLQAAWTSYTSTWTGATTNPTLGNGTQSSAYLQMGKTILVRIAFQFGSTTTYGSGQWRVTLPTTPVNTNRAAFFGDTLSGGATFTIRGFYNSGGPYVQLHTPATTAGATDRVVNSTQPGTYASGDSFTLYGVYESS